MKKNNKPLSEGKGQKLYRRAKGIIPGGTQLLSKDQSFLLRMFGLLTTQKQKGLRFGI